MPDFSVEQFRSLSQQIYQKLGLHFDEKKIYFLKTRVAKRMAALGMDDPRDYVFLVSYADPKGVEMQALANLVTTNETYMFREYDQLQAFANYCLPEVLSAKQARGERTLRIWSAGCSSGEEPYTLAMILQDVFPQAQSWECEIVATDIDENMLRKVVAARYGFRSINEVPEDYRERYLTEDGEEWVVRRRTAALVKPRHLNLQDRMAMRAMRGFRSGGRGPRLTRQSLLEPRTLLGRLPNEPFKSVLVRQFVPSVRRSRGNPFDQVPQDGRVAGQRSPWQSRASGRVEKLARSSLQSFRKGQSFLWCRTVTPAESVLEGQCRRQEVSLRFSHRLREGCGRRCVF